MSKKFDRELVISQEIKDDDLVTAQDFINEFFRRLNDTSPESQHNFEYSFGFQAKGIKIDGEGSGKIEITPMTVQIKRTPFVSKN